MFRSVHCELILCMDVSSHSDRQFFDTLAPRRAQDVRRHRVYYADRLKWLKRFIRHDASIIELGCGTGATLAHLPHARKTGIDFSPAMIELARSHDKTSEYFVDDIQSLHYAKTYDYVLLLDTVNFLTDVQLAFRQIREKLCHSGTHLIITHYNFLWQPLFLIAEKLGWKTKFPEQNWLSRNDIRNLLQMTGFDVIEYGERLLFPLSIPLLSRFCNKYLISLPFFRAFALVKYVVARPLPTERIEQSVTIVSAVRNEKGNISQIVSAMPSIGTATELIFIEGHSVDGTWEEIERVIAEYKGPVTVRGMKQTGTGKANALHCGLLASTNDIIIVYDGDYTVHPSELPKMYDVLADGKAEFVNASRLVYPMEQGSMRILNLFGNKMFSVLFSWLFSQKLVDVLSPLKAFSRFHYQYMTSRRDPFGDFDLFLGGAEQQLKMMEVPVHYLARSYGTTKIRRFHHGWLLLCMCLFGAKRIKWI